MTIDKDTHELHQKNREKFKEMHPDNNAFLRQFRDLDSWEIFFFCKITINYCYFIEL